MASRALPSSGTAASIHFPNRIACFRNAQTTPEHPTGRTTDRLVRPGPHFFPLRPFAAEIPDSLRTNRPFGCRCWASLWLPLVCPPLGGDACRDFFLFEPLGFQTLTIPGASPRLLRRLSPSKCGAQKRSEREAGSDRSTCPGSAPRGFPEPSRPAATRLSAGSSRVPTGRAQGLRHVGRAIDEAAGIPAEGPETRPPRGKQKLRAEGPAEPRGRRASGREGGPACARGEVPG